MVHELARNAAPLNAIYDAFDVVDHLTHRLVERLAMRLHARLKRCCEPRVKLRVDLGLRFTGHGLILLVIAQRFADPNLIIQAFAKCR
jgi:hypothetical protein